MKILTHLIPQAQVAEYFATQTQPYEGTLALTFEYRQKSRCVVEIQEGADRGKMIGLTLPRGTVLRDGDALQTADQASTWRVVAAPEALLHVTASDPLTLLKLAYHLGNRHVPLQIGPTWLRLQVDHVLAGMVRGLGGEVNEIEAAFDPESGAYGHGGGHHHANVDEDESTLAGQHSDGRHAPKIHDFVEPVSTAASPQSVITRALNTA